MSEGYDEDLDMYEESLGMPNKQLDTVTTRLDQPDRGGGELFFYFYNLFMRQFF